ncbi:translation initiation factor IF-1 [Mesomycoplasma hyopneumoniae]|uniref:Translation initiation factor IF-1 n=6 Tax=Mesomycoplasma hyopneumoniae TaxID=2099 RepID=IF1_MESH2|nr:translation initiation factor IF-1 [Mesomycoplasma hyopneumoniae]Q4A8J3.2 RecName: Full=Translation initiation factor IF-1 [Mesomycoplasma hyopneumoniae 7448]Q4AAG2.2 RecName: Full=Translation initiation factor IF-1 [Mesomycoplasma hyopneumoniae J]Q601J2.1 RecName: Full=Translation initiation factor IF-1 [Mesomycoplasma hyopneumoniae 232]CNR88803.1 initiation factor IF-1 [Salmonella enterica subsp. enterica serovar Typhimurium str. DT104]AAV27466.1 translation initiation factor IF-1 [Mesomy
MANLPKEQKLLFQGKVTHVFNAQEYEVTLENGIKLNCHIAGKMKIHHIKIIIGDMVKVEISPYDLSKGRIVYRFK